MKNVNFRSVLYGAMSIFPGLGLIAQGDFRAGAIAFVAVVGVFLLNFFSRVEFIIDMTGYAFWFTWIYQIIYTHQVAERKNIIEAGEDSIKETGKIKAPKGTKFFKRTIFIARETLAAQLNPAEQLQVAILAMNVSGWSLAANQHYVGLTNDQLVLLRMDLMGKPIELKRHEITEIEKISVRPGILNNTLAVKLKSQKKPFKWKVSVIFKKELKKFEQIIQDQVRSNPE